MTSETSNNTMFNSDVVIGLEIHVSLNTTTKLFCSCKNSHSAEENTNICPICLGHPGSRPSLNKKAVEYAIKLAKALNFKIAEELIFSRKTYFYPDLSKNYQITQYEEPLGTDGHVSLYLNNNNNKNNNKSKNEEINESVEKRIGLERIHLEEDPGSLIHKPNYSLIDYNRSGCPLCEIVTKPEITSPEEARAFIKKLLSIVNYLSIFDYENGTIKADLNISIKESGYKRVEIKGVSGFKDIQDALEYEILRQKENPENIIMETRGYDAEQKITIPQRTKETEEDYGYIYESDIVPRKLESKFVENLTKEIPELPDSRINRYMKLKVSENEYITRTDSESLASIKEISDLFDYLISKELDVKTSLRYVTREIISTINEGLIVPKLLDNENLKENIECVVKLFSERKINNHTAREMAYKIVEDVTKNNIQRNTQKNNDNNNLFSAKKYLEENELIIDSSMDLDKICTEVINNNKNVVDDYLSGKHWAVNYLVGQVMKATKGKAMPDDAKNKLISIIEQK